MIERGFVMINRLLIWWAVAAVVVSVVTVVVISRYSQTHPLPADIVSQAGFPLYYPAPSVNGYRYEDSARITHGVVFYTLANDTDESIDVTEQSAPSNPPNVKKLLGFTELKTPAGVGAIGTSSTKRPVAIVISNTTLITVTGPKGLPSDVVGNLAKNMVSLAH